VVDYSVFPPKFLLITKTLHRKDFKLFRSSLRNRCNSATVFRFENRFNFQGLEHINHEIMKVISKRRISLLKSTTPAAIGLCNTLINLCCGHPSFKS